MIFEVFGLSGTGKSTILGQIFQDSSSKGWIGPEAADDRLRQISQSEKNKSLDRWKCGEIISLGLRLISESRMRPSQQITASRLLFTSAQKFKFIEDNYTEFSHVVHDELLLNRAYSILVHFDDIGKVSREYFSKVPLPSVACLVEADVQFTLERVLSRGDTVNVYRGLSESEIEELLRRSQVVAEVGVEVLQARKVPVHRLSAEVSAAEIAAQLGLLMRKYS